MSKIFGFIREVKAGIREAKRQLEIYWFLQRYFTRNHRRILADIDRAN
jgi:hypothetical protein